MAFQSGRGVSAPVGPLSCRFSARVSSSSSFVALSSSRSFRSSSSAARASASASTTRACVSSNFACVFSFMDNARFTLVRVVWLVSSSTRTARSRASTSSCHFLSSSAILTFSPARRSTTEKNGSWSNARASASAR